MCFGVFPFVTHNLKNEKEKNKLFKLLKIKSWFINYLKKIVLGQKINEII